MMFPFRTMFQGFSHDFPMTVMMYPWFSHGFPKIFQAVFPHFNGRFRMDSSKKATFFSRTFRGSVSDLHLRRCFKQQAGGKQKTGGQFWCVSSMNDPWIEIDQNIIQQKLWYNNHIYARYMCMCIYIYTYTYTYICVYIYIYTYM